MALLSRLFGKQNGSKQAVQSNGLSQMNDLAGRASVVSQADQDATRARMEAEMAAQRQQRETGAGKTDA